MAEIDRLDGEIGEKLELRNEVGDDLPAGSPRDWSLFGAEREQLRETLRSFDPSLPGSGWEGCGTLSAAQSSIQSLLDAQGSGESS
jgi:hypothetical protein